MTRKPPPIDTPYPKHRNLTQEEIALWVEAAGKQRKTKQRAYKKPPPCTKTVTYSPPAASPPISLPVSVSKLDSAMRSKVRRGKIALEAILDLHGHTRATAQGVLLRFITQAQARGLRTVLIITGKGKNSSENGILGGWLEHAVSEPPLRGQILACEYAGPQHGGEGAWYIRIRKQTIPML